MRGASTFPLMIATVGVFNAFHPQNRLLLETEPRVIRVTYSKNFLLLRKSAIRRISHGTAFYVREDSRSNRMAWDPAASPLTTVAAEY